MGLAKVTAATIVASLIILAVSVGASQGPPQPAGSLLLAEKLEAAGLTDEARAQALAVLTNARPADQLRYIDLLRRIRASASQSRTNQFYQQLEIGQVLLDAKLYDEAREVLIRAIELAPSTETKSETAAKAALAVAPDDDRMFSASTTGVKIREILETTAAALATGAAGVVLLFLGRWIVRRAASRLSARAGEKSTQVVLHEFGDGTDTGLGKGLPDLVRSLYAEQHRIATAARASGTLLVPHRTPGRMPLLSSAPSHEIADIDLEVGGVKVGRVFAWWDRIRSTPRHNVSGTVYALSDADARATVWIKTVTGRTRSFDAKLSGTRQPHDTAYRILFAILDEWGKKP